MNPISRLRSRLVARYAAADKGALTNYSFVAAIALSATLLIGVTGYTWWNDNLAPAVEVNGQAINKSEALGRAQVAAIRLSVQATRIQARVAAGTLTSDQGNALLQGLSDKADTLTTDVTTSMINALLVRDLAASKGIELDQTAADAAWAAESTLPELRLLRRISINIDLDKGTGKVSDATVAAAQRRVDAIVAELAAGGDFSTIAKRESQDSYAADGGLVRWSTRAEDPTSDPAFAAAWDITAEGETTDAIRHTTTQFIIIKVEKIRAASPDPDFAKALSDAGIDTSTYKRVCAEEVLYSQLKEVVTAELLTDPVTQRDVSYMSISTDQGGDVPEVHVRHILFSPNDDPNAAAALDPADPAWAAAEAEAKAAMAALEGGAKFAKLAATSDDAGSAKTGGLLPWTAKGSYVKPFDDAVWADGLVPSQLLGPIKTDYGWHIIRFEGRRESLRDQLQALLDAATVDGKDFAGAAKQMVQSLSGLEVKSPGWVARYSIAADLSGLVWPLAAGETSGIETTQQQDAYLIVHVNAVEERPLTDAQRSAVEFNGFGLWLDLYRAAAAITIDGSSVQDAGESPQP
ncbi:MAG: peptidylprolyl isomerase [Candidatus Limnocylindrus sp.]